MLLPASLHDLFSQLDFTIMFHAPGAGELSRMLTHRTSCCTQNAPPPEVAWQELKQLHGKLN
jgi:hypothetical protein